MQAPTPAPDMQMALLLTAGGHGSRLGGDQPKQFMHLAGKPIIEHCLDIFAHRRDIGAYVITLPQPYLEDYPPSYWHQRGYDKVKAVVGGGATRQASVYEGLAVMQGWSPDIVLIHDAARCLLEPQTLDRCIEACQTYGASTAAAPVRDSLKKSDNSHLIDSDIERDGVWAVQTPQCFRFAPIWQAHQEALKKNITATDDTALAQRLGLSVKLVSSSLRNLKLTYPEDISLAEAYLSQNQSKETP